MNYIVYFEINVFCICILLVILKKHLSNVDKRNTKRLFILSLCFNISFFALDLVWALIESKICQPPVPITFLVNAAYYVATGFASYYWFLFSESVQPKKIYSQNKKWIIKIPLIILIILVVLSYKWDLIFYIDANNEYHRGQFHILQVIITYGYLIITAIKAFYLSFKPENYLLKSTLISLSTYVIIPAVCAVIQVLFSSISAVCAGITFSFFIVYIDLKDQEVSFDPLTKLNNRLSFMAYLHKKISITTDIFLLIGDIDYFKTVNDRYGHVEGDKALVRVAKALRMSCNKEKAFISRYGGDEFIIVYESDKESEVNKLIETINENINKLDRYENAPYDLKLSIGYAKYDKEIKTIPQFIDKADKLLYDLKKERKRNLLR